MKKLLMATAILAASAASADARVGINLDFSAPGAYYAPAPVYAAPAPVYYAPPPPPPPAYYGYPSGRWRHRNYDWNYWHHR